MIAHAKRSDPNPEDEGLARLKELLADAASASLDLNVSALPQNPEEKQTDPIEVLHNRLEIFGVRLALEVPNAVECANDFHLGLQDILVDPVSLEQSYPAADFESAIIMAESCYLEGQLFTHLFHPVGFSSSSEVLKKGLGSLEVYRQNEKLPEVAAEHYKTSVHSLADFCKVHDPMITALAQTASSRGIIKALQPATFFAAIKAIFPKPTDFTAHYKECFTVYDAYLSGVSLALQAGGCCSQTAGLFLGALLEQQQRSPVLEELRINIASNAAKVVYFQEMQ